jgi:hypothetical protein
MRVLVCGSRYYEDYEKLREVLSGIHIGTIIHGCARGADKLGGRYAEANNIPVCEFPADWGKYGKRAGPIRNRQMLIEGRPDMVVAFRGPNSRGTQNMIEQAEKAGVSVKIVEITDE